MRKALFVSASSKTGSANWHLARAAKSLLDRKARSGLHTELIDLAAPELPTFSPEAEVSPAVADFIERVSEATAIVMSSDEYTGAYSSKLRNALLWVRRLSTTPDAPLKGRHIFLIGLSPRGAGGLRGHAALNQLLSEFGANVSSQYIVMGSAPSAFDGEMQLAEKAERQLLSGSLRSLVDE